MGFSLIVVLLSWGGGSWPLDPQDGTPSCHRTRLTCSHASAAACSGLRAPRAPAQAGSFFGTKLPIAALW